MKPADYVQIEDKQVSVIRFYDKRRNKSLLAITKTDGLHLDELTAFDCNCCRVTVDKDFSTYPRPASSMESGVTMRVTTPSAVLVGSVVVRIRAAQNSSNFKFREHKRP